MKKTLFLLFIISVFLLKDAAAVFVPIQFTSGLNEDVIANGIGNASSSTTTDMDGSNYVLVCQNYQTTATSTPLTFGLPTNGILTSAATTGLTFNFSPFATPYSGSNALKITGVANGTLNFQTPIAAQTVYILITSTFTATLAGTITFSDGSTQAIAGTAVPNWYGGTTLPNAATGIGRILRTTNVTQNQTPDPRLYQVAVTIPAADQTKLINSITINNTSTTANSKLFVFAITVAATPISCNAPTALTATSLTPTGATLGWSQVGTPLGWKVIYGTSGFNPATSGTSTYTTTNSLSLSTLSPATAYSFYVKTACAVGDSSTLAGPYTFTTPCQPPAITGNTPGFHCGPGTVTLNATAGTGGSIKWYTALTGGTAVASGNSYTTPSLSANTNYYISAIQGTCESSPRQIITASIRPIPVVNLGHDTTICPGVAYTFNAGNTGGTYVWSTGETTQTVTKNAVGIYSVSATVNSCTGRDTITITPGITPVNALPDTTNLCNGSTATLDAGNSGFYYVWSPGGAITQTITAATEGLYGVNIKSIDGCKINSGTYLKIRPLPVNNMGNDTIICPSTSLLLNAGNNDYSYSWNTGAHTQTINSSDSGDYVVTVTSPYGCQNVDDMHIAFIPSPKTEGFSFIPKFFEALGKVEFSPLNPTNVTGYEWNFGDGTAPVFTVNPTHTYNAPGNYLVTLTVHNDCDTFDISQQIYVELAGGNTGVTTIHANPFNISLYPNPVNDLLNIKTIAPDVSILEITLFNASGAVVYKHHTNTAVIYQIPVNTFANGIYTVRIETNQGIENRLISIIK